MVINANVSVSYSSIENNGLQSINTGVYISSGARVFFDSSRIQNNNGSGLKIYGLGTRALLTPDSLKTGYNTITQHGVSEIWLLSSGSAFLGGGFYPGNCGGANNVYNNFNYSCRLINNATSNQVSAKWTYWGSTGNRFCGPVDSTNQLSNPINTPAVMAYIPVGEENPVVPSKPTALSDWLVQLKNDVVSNNINAFDALHQLAIYAGPGGSYQNVLGSTWEGFLGNIENTATSASVSSLASAFFIQSKLDNEDFGNAIVMADSILGKNVDDDLWFFCQTRKIFAHVGTGDIANAQSVFNTMKTRAEKFDSDAVKAMNDYISVATKSINASSSHFSFVKSRSMQMSTKPSRYALEQNFPNPFNPTTSIRYEVPENVFVRVQIFDVLGREVSELVNDYKNKGKYEVSFDAGKFPSGVYFYRLQARSFTGIKKMLLAK